jgi:hypothetical protein
MSFFSSLFEGDTKGAIGALKADPVGDALAVGALAVPAALTSPLWAPALGLGGGLGFLGGLGADAAGAGVGAAGAGTLGSTAPLDFASLGGLPGAAGTAGGVGGVGDIAGLAGDVPGMAGGTPLVGLESPIGGAPGSAAAFTGGVPGGVPGAAAGIAGGGGASAIGTAAPAGTGVPDATTGGIAGGTGIDTVTSGGGPGVSGGGPQLAQPPGTQASPQSLMQSIQNIPSSAMSKIVANPLGTLGAGVGLGSSILSAKNTLAGLPQMTQGAGTVQTVGENQVMLAQSGQLPGSQQAALDQQLQQQIMKIKSTYASMGASGSTMEAQALADAQNNYQTTKGNLILANLNQGATTVGMGNQAFQAVAQTQAAQQAAMAKALAQFTGALGGGGVPKTQVASTDTTQATG